jgi:hypothetical protein
MVRLLQAKTKRLEKEQQQSPLPWVIVCLSPLAFWTVNKSADITKYSAVNVHNIKTQPQEVLPHAPAEILSSFCFECLFKPGVTCLDHAQYLSTRDGCTLEACKKLVMKSEPQGCDITNYKLTATWKPRMLFGIFTYDSPNEWDLRQANRETFLSYFKNRAAIMVSNQPDAKSIDELDNYSPDTICSLSELMNNVTLARSPVKCRFVYTFVMGGGIGDPIMRQKITNLTANGKELMDKLKTRCLWEDPACGGTDIVRWTLDYRKTNLSDAWAGELAKYRDTTILSIPENHNLGKTDTWFTYISMLTQEHPELEINFVGKMDGDNFIHFPIFYRFLGNIREQMETNPYIYAGWAVSKKLCSKPSWGSLCASENFITPLFATGAIAYLSTPLSHHVFLNGTSLERKREVFMSYEDMQLANMAYLDPNITVLVLNHRSYRPDITTHCSNNPVCLRTKYYKAFPELRNTSRASEK